MTEPPCDLSFDISFDRLGDRLNENEPESPSNPAVLRVDVTGPDGETYSAATHLPEDSSPAVQAAFTARLRSALAAQPDGSPRRVVEQCSWWTPDDLRA